MLQYVNNGRIENGELNRLFFAAWQDWKARDFHAVLQRSLGYVSVLDDEWLVGFVNVAWDGGIHAFLLDTTVHPDYRQRGIGRRLVTEAIRLAREKGAEWLHVDFEESLGEFYSRCGFRHTAAGVIRLFEG